MANAAVGLVNLAGLLIDPSVEPIPPVQPFTPKSDYFGGKGEATADGLMVTGGGRALGKGLNKLVTARVADDVWKLSPTERGNAIESALAKSEYKDWYNIGNSHNGYFPLVDFQKGMNLVSLKSVNTGGSSWMGRMQSHIKDLGSRGATVDGQRANMILDLRVQPGGLKDASSLVQYGRDRGVSVMVKEF